MEYNFYQMIMELSTRASFADNSQIGMEHIIICMYVHVVRVSGACMLYHQLKGRNLTQDWATHLSMYAPFRFDLQSRPYHQPDEYSSAQLS